MTMTNYDGPKDGDFIAYIERLQKESAARLQLQVGFESEAAMTKLPKVPLFGATPAMASESTPGSTRGAAKFEPSPMAEAALLRQLRTSTPASRLITGGFAAALGAFLLLQGFMFNSGVLAILIGIGLIVWALPRLRAALGSQHRDKPLVNREVVEQWFGKKPK